MAEATTPMPIGEKSQEAVIIYLSSALSTFATSFNLRAQLVQRDQAYYRTGDTTLAQANAKAANNMGDPTKIQNITVPVVMPHVETALASLQEVFLTGYPIFGAVAPPAQAASIEQLETQLGENSIRCAWPLHLLQVFRDGLKYDYAALEVVWQKKTIFAITTPEDSKITEGSATETLYEGNFLTRLDPYNVFTDPRVSPEQNHISGEFAGVTEMLSRIETKKRMEDLQALGALTMNFKAALESPGPGSSAYMQDIAGSYYIPSINPDALLSVANRNTFNWLNWVGITSTVQTNEAERIRYGNCYEWTTLYARILPSDFGMRVKNRNHVQIWKFIIVNKSVVIFAERQTNAHNYLPILICKPSCDGMAWQSKSFAENVIPIQQIASSLFNSALESQRRKVYDRIYYDPSRINKKDIDVVSSVARIPVKNTMYGKTIAEAIHESPYRDEGAAETLQIAQQVTRMGDDVLGQNRVQQGQFQKGNKTRKEFDTVMGNAGSRDRMRALAIEYSFMVPLKTIVLSNILQYQPPASIVNSQTGAVVQIDPATLRKANLSLKLSDGYMPSEKLAGTDTIATIFQAAQAMPQIDAEYDLMGMLIYSMELQGAGWMSQFKRTDQEAQARMMQMQQAALASGQKNPPPAKQPEGA